MNIISDILYWISTGLLVPDIVLLIVLFGRALLLVGSFYGQYLSIRKTEALLRNELNALTPATVMELADKLPEKSSSLVISYIRQVLQAHESPAQIQRLLANFEIAADKDLAISKTLTKLGPILGLMGTLIPMGPALDGTPKQYYHAVTQTVKSYLFLSSSPSVRRSEHCFGVPSRVADTASV